MSTVSPSSERSLALETHSKELSIINKRGLHARASAKFVGVVARFKAEITVEKDDMTVGGTSIMGLMMLAASQNTSIVVSATGPQAHEALLAIEELVAAKFHEDE